MSTNNAIEAKAILNAPHWDGLGWDSRIRVAYIDGTIHILSTDIDLALGKHGHGHTLTGVPQDEKQKVKIPRDELKEGEKQLTHTTIKIPTLRSRIQKMRIDGEKKQQMLAWVDALGNMPAYLEVLAYPTPPTGWRAHKTHVTKVTDSRYWRWECKDCDSTDKEFTLCESREQAFQAASQHSTRNAVRAYNPAK